MRTTSYVLIALVFIFVANVIASLALPAYRDILRSWRTEIMGQAGTRYFSAETNIKSSNLEHSLDRIDASIQELVNRSDVPTGSGEISGSGNISWSGGVVIDPIENSGAIKSPSPLVPISGLFLAKIMPEITLESKENAGMFGIYIFDKIPFSTYVDKKKHITVYAFDTSYDTLLVNMKLTSSVYSVNETDQFFGYSFFLNPVKKDLIIRFVTALEWRAIGVEVPKSYYPTLKNMLLKP